MGLNGDCFVVLKEILQAAVLCWTHCFLTPILFRQRVRQCVCGGVWAAHRARLPLELFLYGGGVQPSRPVTVGHHLPREEYKSSHLQHHHHSHWSAATKYTLLTQLFSYVLFEFFFLLMCFSQKRRKKLCGAWRTMFHMCCLWQRDFSTVHCCYRHSSQGNFFPPTHPVSHIKWYPASNNDTYLKFHYTATLRQY